MGCDIHLRIEKRVGGSQWCNVPWTCEDHRKWPMEQPDQDAVEMPDSLDGRNYNLFAILADVRQKTWGERLEPIAQPRGIPRDSPLYSEEYADIEPWIGDHSFSYVTLKELQDYPWQDPYRYTAWVSKEQAEQFALDGKQPKSWAGGMSNGVQISWISTIEKAVREWNKDVLPVLAKLGDPEDVRLVFGFDS